MKRKVDQGEKGIEGDKISSMEEILAMEKVRRFIKKDEFYESERDTEIADFNKSAEISAIRDGKSSVIRYDKMQGRPSVTVEIQGEIMECLLDTGARVNVMSWQNFQRLSQVELLRANTTLRCANGEKLETKGEARVRVTLNDKERWITFTIVEHVIPDVIGGVEMQRIFGLELRWSEESVDRHI